MKKLIGITAVALIIAIVSSCKKDITELPLSAGDLNNYYKSSKDMTAAIAGMYTSFQEEMTGVGTGKDASDGTEAYGGRYHYWGEGRSDNFDRSQYVNSTMTELAFNNLTINNPATDWGGLYRTIYRANLNIKYFPPIAKSDPLVTPIVLNNALAQCYAMRAECYFYIVRLWGDAPVWTEPYTDVTQPSARPRVAKAKIIDSVIIPDLANAYSLIQKNQTPIVWNINEGAICAMMADVYMWRAGQPGGGQTDYQNAITWIQRLFLAKGPTGVAYGGTTAANLETQTNWKNLFIAPTTSIEPIWSIHWDNTVNGCACIPITTQLSNNPVKADSVVYFTWKKNNKVDTRFAKTIDSTATTTASTQLAHMDKVLKYFNTNNNANGILPTGSTALSLNVYLVMYRLGDVYLSLAEAYAQTGDLTNALKYLNFIYLRARITGTPAIPATQYTTTVAMENAILQERQYELYAEGKRWFDLVRTGNVKNVMDPVVARRQKAFGTAQTGFQDLNKVLWPLSQDALNSNPLLVQNP
ncbi:RagB/SusD family nutrient uptake outer membrane protein [Mucilaginibacter sp. HMF5004]|uniref:RagB/SusD family nutrient uptake outer membrane protein n=1 Tax=Mucilaginibacter rivuli TaxID=2857527 RepID=UPI001C5E1736|nr:RagB/SusD family nutrient uptake outer membrane protein [Mucilaginibacter rivuli]MBW4889226.1 RagB/SusD family nutrient uptake outer membrane protein [Mucilaginibacter rivuli]